MTPVDYTHLPEPIPVEDLIAEVDARPVPDPEAGQNPEQNFAVRFGIA